jgi:hypothetical protein
MKNRSEPIRRQKRPWWKIKESSGDLTKYKQPANKLHENTTITKPFAMDKNNAASV